MLKLVLAPCSLLPPRPPGPGVAARHFPSILSVCPLAFQAPLSSVAGARVSNPQPIPFLCRLPIRELCFPASLAGQNRSWGLAEVPTAMAPLASRVVPAPGSAGTAILSSPPRLPHSSDYPVLSARGPFIPPPSFRAEAQPQPHLPQSAVRGRRQDTHGVQWRSFWRGNAVPAGTAQAETQVEPGAESPTEDATPDKVEQDASLSANGNGNAKGNGRPLDAEAAGTEALGASQPVTEATAGTETNGTAGSPAQALAQAQAQAAVQAQAQAQAEKSPGSGKGKAKEKGKSKSKDGSSGRNKGKKAGEAPSGSSSKEAIRALRIQKVADMRSEGRDPYAYTWPRTHRAADLQREYASLVDGEEPEPAPEICVAGRVMAKRVMGKLAFLTIRDEDATVQLFCAAAAMDAANPGAFTHLKGGAVDTGDIVGAKGGIKRTERGELSVTVRQLEVLTKSLLPLPDKWHGLTDVETRYRQRYLDMIVNPEVTSVFRARAKVVSVIRRYMEDAGFVEVETPVLQAEAGGAEARPFVTHHNALNRDMYLRIATELHLKRMIVGGFDRVFEMGRIFRNEGISTRHNPEFTSIEMYQAYGDYHDMMALAEALVEAAALATQGSLSVTYQGEAISLVRPWRRASMDALVREATGVDFLPLQEAPLGEVISAAQAALEQAQQRGIVDAKGVAGARRKLVQCPSWGHALNEVFEAVVEKQLVQPTFVMDHPVAVSPLAKPHRSRPGLTERFELFVCGRELANAFSELTDPLDQRARLEQQVAAHQAKRLAAADGAGDQGEEDDDVAYDVQLDEDFLTALEYGMPPTAGMGIGIDRLVMLLTDSASIRDVIPFPVLRDTAPQPPSAEGPEHAA